ncbi:MAG: outer membrane beta-barrel protein [Bryobacterales bacterium]|nr:outer membrane beta-barrel protein [Bryobacterales bacterium]
MRTFFLLILGTGFAFGQSAEFSVTGGVSRLNNSQLGGFADSAGSSTYSLTNGWRIGFRTTVNNWRFFGHEFGYGYNRTQLRLEETSTETGMAIHQGFYNFLAYATPDGSRVRPFMAGGGHFNNYTPPGASVTSGGGSTKIGFNYGGGVKVRVSPIFAIRFDVRQYQNSKPFEFLQNRKGLIGQLEVSVGFGLVI